jgi:hypothetical protein
MPDHPFPWSSYRGTAVDDPRRSWPSTASSRQQVAPHGAGTTDRRDEVDIIVGEDFSGPGLRINSASPQRISIRRENNDRTRMDDTVFTAWTTPFVTLNIV